MVAHLRRLAEDFCDPRAERTGRSHRVELLANFTVSLGGADVGSRASPPDLLTVPDFDVDRAIFAKVLGNFDPLPYLGVFHAACYEDPSLLDLRRLPETHRPDVPSTPSPPQRGAPSEVLCFMRQWDAAGRLDLEHPRFAAADEQGSLFPVYKDAETDRIVFNRIPRNEKEFHLPGYSKFTIAGSDLVDLHVPVGMKLRFCTDDLADCYPAMLVSAARGRSNALAFTAPLCAFDGTTALRRFRKKCATEGVPLPRRLRPLHRGLPMGDLNAVEWCAESHARLLRSMGSLPPSSTLQNGKPFPRGGHVEGLVLDDHLGIAIDPETLDPEDPRSHAARLVQSFDSANIGYERTGWKASAQKARRLHSSGAFLGAELLPDSLFLGSERYRRQELARASWALAEHGKATVAVLQRLLSTWVHAMLFRRPLLAVLADVYKQIRPDIDPHEVFSLTQRARHVFARLAVLAPTMVVNLAADYAPILSATDASTYGQGSCRARVPCEVTAELWRYRDKRGAYTKLYSEWSRSLCLGGDRDAADELEPDLFGTAPSPMRVLIETWDFLEIFGGPRSPLASAVSASGLRVGPAVDLRTSRLWDVTQIRIVEWLCFLAERKRVWCWHLWLPCRSFLTASPSCSRTVQQPWGGNILQTERRENFLLKVVHVIFRITLRVDFGQVVHMAPSTSLSWAVPTWSAMEGQTNFSYDLVTWTHPVGEMRVAGLRAGFLSSLSSASRSADGLPFDIQGWAMHYAEQVARLHRMDPPSLGEEEAAEMSALRPGACEKLWLNDLVRALPWEVNRCDDDHTPEHINVKEIKGALQEVMKIAQKFPSSRIVNLMDSRVAIGACAKGRSTSQLLNAELLAALPFLIGCDSYPGFLFVPTRFHPPDGASRGSSSPPPISATLPPWVFQLADSCYNLFDEMASLPPQPRAVSDWARLVVRLSWSGNVKLAPRARPFDATLGYPGEGPRRPLLPDRPAIDLRTFRNLTPAVLKRRQRARSELALFVYAYGFGDFEAFISAPPAVIDKILADWGQRLWQAGRALGDLTAGILAVTDHRRPLRGTLQGAWEVAHVWKSLLPAGNRTPLPERAFLAILTLCLAWGWYDIAVLFGAGFLGLLRPHEMLSLSPAELLTPSRMLASLGPMFVIIRRPKMRRLTAKRSYVRIDEPGFIDFVDAFLAWAPAHHRIFLGGIMTSHGSSRTCAATWGCRLKESRRLRLARSALVGQPGFIVCRILPKWSASGEDGRVRTCWRSTYKKSEQRLSSRRYNKIHCTAYITLQQLPRRLWLRRHLFFGANQPPHHRRRIWGSWTETQPRPPARRESAAPTTEPDAREQTKQQTKRRSESFSMTMAVVARSFLHLFVSSTFRSLCFLTLNRESTDKSVPRFLHVLGE